MSDFELRLLALETLAGGLVVVERRSQAVHLRQVPEIIAEHILRGGGE